jgi:hypothetical protein
MVRRINYDCFVFIVVGWWLTLDICRCDGLPCSRHFVCEVTSHGKSDVCPRLVLDGGPTVEFWR